MATSFKLKFSGVVILLSILVATVGCKKEKNDRFSDTGLQQYWVYQKSIDVQDHVINEFPFDPDEFYQFEINIKFLYNPETGLIEAQGQGPERLFWTEYSVDKHKLSKKQFMINSLPISNQMLRTFETSFFANLIAVNGYEIKSGLLYLSYGKNGERMVFKLREKQYALLTTAYLTASIDGKDWKADAEEVRAIVEQQVFSFGGTRENGNAEENNSVIGFGFSFPAAKGKYFFNNTGIILPVAMGAYASYTVASKSGSSTDARSKSGFIEITTITRSFIEGNFEFDAETYSSGTKKAFSIKSGMFLVPVSGGGSGWFNTYIP